MTLILVFFVGQLTVSLSSLTSHLQMTGFFRTASLFNSTFFLVFLEYSVMVSLHVQPVFFFFRLLLYFALTDITHLID